MEGNIMESNHDSQGNQILSLEIAGVRDNPINFIGK